MKLPIYMDHHATTPADPRVLKAMLPDVTEHVGSAASRQHSFGWAAQAAAETARAQVAELTRDRLKNRILSRLDKVHINGDTEHRLPRNLHLSFAGVN